MDVLRLLDREVGWEGTHLVILSTMATKVAPTTSILETINSIQKNEEDISSHKLLIEI